MKLNAKFLGLFILAALAVGCSKDTYVAKPVYNDATSTQDLTVPADFDWKTTRNMVVKINPANSGVMIIQNESGATYQKVFVNAKENYSTTINIPVANKALHIYFNGNSEIISVNSSTVNSTLK